MVPWECPPQETTVLPPPSIVAHTTSLQVVLHVDDPPIKHQGITYPQVHPWGHSLVASFGLFLILESFLGLRQI